MKISTTEITLNIMQETHKQGKGILDPTLETITHLLAINWKKKNSHTFATCQFKQNNINLQQQSTQDKAARQHLEILHNIIHQYLCRFIYIVVQHKAISRVSHHIHKETSQHSSAKTFNPWSPTDLKHLKLSTTEFYKKQ